MVPILQAQIQVRVIVFSTEEGGHVAQCVDVDFAAHGRTIKDALERFQKAFVAQFLVDMSEARAPFERFHAPPPKYVVMYQQAFLKCGPLGPMPIPADNAMPERMKKAKPTAAPSISDVRIWD